MWLPIVGAGCSALNPILAFDDSTTIQLTDGQVVWPLTEGARPAWSPDGRQLTFTRGEGDDEEIFVIDVGGGSIRQLTSNAVRDSEPTWSPGGTEILFMREGEGTNELWTVGVDGSGEAQATFVEGYADSPTWGAAGMVYANAALEPWPLYLQTAPGADPEVLVQSDVVYLNDAHWSPDGSMLTMSGYPTNDNQEVYRVDADGENLERLTDHPADDDEASISPDGSFLIFESDRSGVLDLWTMAPDGGEAELWLPEPPSTHRRRPAFRP